MHPSQFTRRRKRHLDVLPPPDSSLVKGVNDNNAFCRTKLKMSPYPETVGLSLNSPHPLREVNRDRPHRAFPVAEMDATIPNLEQGTSALSTPSSFHVSTTAHRMALENSSGLNMFLDFGEGEVDGKRFSGLKPTNVVSLEKKLSAHLEECGGEDGEVEKGSGHDGSERMLGKVESERSHVFAGQEEGVSHQPTAHVRGMWDSVVSWMKMATDFIARDSNETAEPVVAKASRGKKRGLSDPDFTDSPTKKQPRSLLSGDKGRGRRKDKTGKGKSSQEPHGVARSEEFSLQPSAVFSDVPSSPIASLVPVSSPPSVLATQLSNKLAIASPVLLQESATTTKWKPSHLEACSGSNLGLNSILDKSFQSVPKKIRRQSLRSFYGNSVNSPNLTEVPASSITVRRSPRNHSSSTIPAPPPPPPIPVAPPLPPLPHFPLPGTANKTTAAPPLAFSPALPRTGGADPSRDMLSQMQSRLRSRIKKKGAGRMDSVKSGSGGLSNVDGSGLDVKNRQWAEIQAHRRKISLEEFFALAAKKKKELRQVLGDLEQSLPSTFRGVAEVVETLQEGAQWFPGGNKDMRESLPLYKKLEQKCETLTEYIHVCLEMSEVAAVDPPVSTSGAQKQGTLEGCLHQLREEFDARHRHWGAIVASNAQSWSSLDLPVCHHLLRRSCDYMCELVRRYVNSCLEEAEHLNGVLVARKCTRTTKSKEALKSCLNFLSDSTLYFCYDRTLKCSSPNCHFCSPLSQSSVITPVSSGMDLHRHTSSPSRGTVDPPAYDQSLLVSFIVAVLKSYASIALSQYNGYLLHSSRQDVCEQFEGILKLISIVKAILCVVFSTKAHSVRNSGGYLQLIQEPEELGQKLYECCEKLVQHIVDKASPMETGQVSPSKQDILSKEIMLWMMFGCKYIHQSLEFLGTERAQKMGLVKLLQQLQHMEDLL